MQALAGAGAPHNVAGGGTAATGRSGGNDGGRPRPALRGVSHEVFFFVSLVTGPLLGLAAPTTKAQLCVSVYAFSTTMMLGTSALFHRHRWSSEAARKRMRRADHSTIFLFIAGTYTAVAGLSLGAGWAALVLSLVWAGAAGGIALRWAWLGAPKWAVALPYVAVGWVALVAMPELAHRLGGAGLGLMVGGGVLYTLGAVAYARKRPNPWPTVFGYHEIFHALVVVALILHYCLVAFVVLPAVKP
jgi:hemolysin III